MKRLFTSLFLATALILCILQPCFSEASSFSDGFNDGNADGWIFATRDLRVPDKTGNWRVEDGKLVQDDGGDERLALVENLYLSNQSISTLQQVAYYNGYSGLTLWYQDTNNYVAVFL